ncbi:MAG: hypothetical protein ACXV3D_07365, partial [Halobacteriota archaeon]
WVYSFLLSGYSAMLTKELCAFGKLERSKQAAALKIQKLVVDLLPWQDRLEYNITVLRTASR